MAENKSMHTVNGGQDGAADGDHQMTTTTTTTTTTSGVVVQGEAEDHYPSSPRRPSSSSSSAVATELARKTAGLPRAARVIMMQRNINAAKKNKEKRRRQQRKKAASLKQRNRKCRVCKIFRRGQFCCDASDFSKAYLTHLQKSTHPIIPEAAFRRLVKEIGTNIKVDLRFSDEAIDAIQESAEECVVEHLQLASVLASHAKRVTTMKTDFELASKLLAGGSGINRSFFK